MLFPLMSNHLSFPSLVFQNEVLGTLQRGEEENISCDNLVLKSTPSSEFSLRDAVPYAEQLGLTVDLERRGETM